MPPAALRAPRLRARLRAPRETVTQPEQVTLSRWAARRDKTAPRVEREVRERILQQKCSEHFLRGRHHAPHRLRPVLFYTRMISCEHPTIVWR